MPGLVLADPAVVPAFIHNPHDLAIVRFVHARQASAWQLSAAKAPQDTHFENPKIRILKTLDSLAARPV